MLRLTICVPVLTGKVLTVYVSHIFFGRNGPGYSVQSFEMRLD